MIIKDTDILKATAKILNNKFGYDIYTQPDDEKVKVPTFYISLTHLKTENYKEYNQKNINLFITYTNLGVQQEELLDISNELDGLFSIYLIVNEFYINISQKKFTDPNNSDLITMTLTLDFKDSDEVINTAELMENLNLNTIERND